MADVFHKAARDGYLDLLREATRRDCDQPDEDGMTPTQWAAYYGNLDALRMIIIRGGNPDKCDIFGSSALHHATASNHMNCVTFLVSFGANLWCLDNDFHTAMDIAGLHGHEEIMKYLDTVAAKQALRNKKLVAKFKQRAVLDAKKCIKRYDKLQAKVDKRAAKMNKKLSKDKSPTTPIERSSNYSAPSSVYSTLRRLSVNSGRTAFSEPKPYSNHFTMNSKTGKKWLSGVPRRIGKVPKGRSSGSDADFKITELEMDGRQTIRSISGLKRDHHVMYVRNGHDSTLGSISSGSGKSLALEDDVFYGQGKGHDDAISRAISEPDFLAIQEDSGIESGDSYPAENSGMFERPGFGNVAFINHRIPSGALLSLPYESSTDAAERSRTLPLPSRRRVNGSDDKRGRVQRRGSLSDSIGTVGSLATRIKDLPWDEEEIDDLEDEEDDLTKSSPLELFLVANGLVGLMSMFSQEKIDLQALLLLTDMDLKDLGLPLGPRRKVMDAIARRKAALTAPGVVCDTRL